MVTALMALSFLTGVGAGVLGTCLYLSGVFK